MSSPAADVVKEVYEAWARTDLAAIERLYGRDIVLDWSRRQLHPLVAEGRAPALRATADLFDAFSEQRPEIERLVEQGERVVALVRAHGRGRASGAVVDAHVGHVWTIRDGLVQRMEYYGDQDEALAAAGVPP
jgi:ketosteroid isomerase-like protein